MDSGHIAVASLYHEAIPGAAQRFAFRCEARFFINRLAHQGEKITCDVNSLIFNEQSCKHGPRHQYVKQYWLLSVSTIRLIRSGKRRPAMTD